MEAHLALNDLTQWKILTDNTDILLVAALDQND